MDESQWHKNKDDTNIFLSIYDSQGTTLSEFTDITCVEPTVLVEVFGRFLGIFVITFRDVPPSNPYLTFVIFGEVVHLRYTHKFDLYNFVTEVSGT